MSDFWYRDPIPPYEDWQGNLWTVDGGELRLAELRAEVDMRLVAEWQREYLGVWPS